MKLEFKDYVLTTDIRNFIVERKSIIQAGTFTKEENIGKVKLTDPQYCTTLNSALNLLCKDVLLDNDDLQVILVKLIEIEAKIEEFSKLLKQGYGYQI